MIETVVRECIGVNMKKGCEYIWSSHVGFGR